MKKQTLRTIQNKNAVVLALEMLVEDDSVGRAGFYAGLLTPLVDRSIPVIRSALALLEDEGRIVRLDWRDGLSCTILVLMDRPGARAFIREVRESHCDESTRFDRRGRLRRPIGGEAEAQALGGTG